MSSNDWLANYLVKFVKKIILKLVLLYQKSSKDEHDWTPKLI